MKLSLIVIFMIVFTFNLFCEVDHPELGLYSDPEALTDAVLLSIRDNDVNKLHQTICTPAEVAYLVENVPASADREQLDQFRKLIQNGYTMIAPKIIEQFSNVNFKLISPNNREYDYTIKTIKGYENEGISVLGMKVKDVMLPSKIQIVAFRYNGYWRVIMADKLVE
ncbi:MAG: hypothetical protein K9L62_16270 [Vallitaleaceae bacterium]|nr:hypothetical protein [Vallitaleaceae bacterium]